MNQQQYTLKEEEPHLVVDQGGLIQSSNIKCGELFGYSCMEVMEQPITMLIPEFASGGKDSSAYNGKIGITKNGAPIVLSYHVYPFSLIDMSFYMVVIKNQMERSTENQLLVQSQIKLTNLEKVLQQSLGELYDLKFAIDESSIVAITNPKGIITYVNDKFCEISKYSKEDLIGQTHRMINSGHHSFQFFQELWKTISAGRVWKGEIKNKAKDGSYYWVDTTIVPFLRGETPYQYLAIRNEITKRKKVEEQLKNLLTKVINLQEEERRFLSRELHDQIGQKLYSLLIHVNYLKSTTSENTVIDQVEADISNLIEDIREISWQLRPSVLDDLGLIPAIRSFITRFSKFYHIKVTFTSAVSRRLEPYIETTIYRIAQESLTNIRKYADVKEASVHIGEDDNDLFMTIIDKGKGFNLEEISRNVGLTSMEERADSIGANLIIQSEVGKGTKIELNIPKFNID